MSKKHAFNQEVIIGPFANDDKWVKFKSICSQLGFTVRVTGGVFLTHELNGTIKDFEIILDLVNDPMVIFGK